MSSATRLEQFVRQLEAEGPDVFRSRVSPVLVREGRAADWEDDDHSYQTGFMSRDEMRRATRQAFEVRDDEPSEEASQPTVDEVYVVGKREGGAFQDRIGVGRAPNVDVRIPFPRISKYHAFFTWDEHGYYLTDAGSKNGTAIGGEALEPKVAAKLKDGAAVELGPYSFRFYTPEGFVALVSSKLT